MALLRVIIFNGFAVAGGLFLFGIAQEVVSLFVDQRTIRAAIVCGIMCLVTFGLYFLKEHTREFYRFTALATGIPLMELFEGGFGFLLFAAVYIIGAGYLIFLWRPRECSSG
ncbi:hypothetical protein EH31_04650 [Erythrobacter longus]|uniref:Uncharacterized protein n=1 Tax=Erythrobacter longus TaxID=1044 RepID=A0A074N216_ERYLO|nr:hypothetical protein EH31_04650 [Erythrobacter longus]